MADRRHTWSLPDQVLQFGRRPLVMGILNVTPDSFSDGGQFARPEAAVARGLELVEAGADLLDIGGESSRPGSAPVALEEERRRVLPVVEQLAPRAGVPLSVDTTKAEIARVCLAAGARIINDITALAGDPAMPDLVRTFRAGAILMHMQGTPATMQDEPRYLDVVAEIARFFEERLHVLAQQGIAEEQIVLDPGLGFGKTLDHNLRLLAELGQFQRLGRPVCLGASRKGFIGCVLNRPLDQRLAGSLAVAVLAAVNGTAQIVRVHDVRETRDALALVERIQEAGEQIGELGEEGQPESSGKE